MTRYSLAAGGSVREAVIKASTGSCGANLSGTVVPVVRFCRGRVYTREDDERRCRSAPPLRLRRRRGRLYRVGAPASQPHLSSRSPHYRRPGPGARRGPDGFRRPGPQGPAPASRSRTARLGVPGGLSDGVEVEPQQPAPDRTRKAGHERYAPSKRSRTRHGRITDPSGSGEYHSGAGTRALLDLRGCLARTCVFADGHSEIHRAATLEELEAWEHERTSQGQHGGSRAFQTSPARREAVSSQDNDAPAACRY